jgi:uncharacterized protein (TIGR03118 family)
MKAIALRGLAVGMVLAAGSAVAGVPNIAPGSAYRQANLVSDVAGVALLQDEYLVNPWGMAVRGTSPLWVANAGTSTSTVYREEADTDYFAINAGLPRIVIPGGLPTGIVGNATVDFVVSDGVNSGASAFIFNSITGNHLGWSASVPPGATQARVAASSPGQVFTGLAIGANAGGNRLYAADFAAGVIRVRTGTFANTTVPGGFVDATIPAGYRPHNIQNLGGSLYVAYALAGMDGLPVNGVGNGYVRKFNTDGVRDLTFAINAGQLNAPWGMAIAPASFGIFGGALIVGNFSDNGTLHAYNPSTGAFLGTLQDENGVAIGIDQLWALRFGNGSLGGDLNALYFTAGIGREEHGLLGALRATTATATSLIELSNATYSVNEYLGAIDITVLRAGDLSTQATVNYASYARSGAGQAGAADYTLAPGTLTFAPGQSSRTFTVAVKKDGLVETAEALTLVLSNPAGAGTGLALDQAVLTITDPGVFANGFE